MVGQRSVNSTSTLVAVAPSFVYLSAAFNYTNMPMNDEADKAVMDESGTEAAGTSSNPQPEQVVNQPNDVPEEISLDEFQQLKSKAAKADENWNQLLRVSADFDNYKKRAARERQEAIRFANESLFEKLIPVLDNFEMAIQAA